MKLAPRSSDTVVIGLPTPQDTERYVTRHQLAERMGVSVSTIDRMVRAGMPSVTWGSRCRRFLPSRAIAWACANQERRATAA